MKMLQDALIRRARAIEPQLSPEEIDGLHDRTSLVTLEVALRLRANDLVYFSMRDQTIRYGETMVTVHRTTLGSLVLEAECDRRMIELSRAAMGMVG